MPGTVMLEWLNEQVLRWREGRCILCGLEILECDCGEYEDEYRPVQADADPGPP